MENKFTYYEEVGKDEIVELITDFERLSQKVLEKYDENTCITMGILIADHRQSEAREYMLNYLNRFDELSGKYIDFYIPGYYMYSKDSKDEWEKRDHFNICISRHCSSKNPVYLDRIASPYYFDDYLFEDFLREFEKKTGIKYTYNPMLILVEVKKDKYRGMLQLQNKMVIELDDNTPRGIRRSGQLFEAIFDIAKREVNLDRFGKALRMRFIKGNIVQKIASTLDGNIIEAIEESVEGIMTYRIK